MKIETMPVHFSPILGGLSMTAGNVTLLQTHLDTIHWEYLSDDDGGNTDEKEGSMRWKTVIIGSVKNLSHIPSCGGSDC